VICMIRQIALTSSLWFLFSFGVPSAFAEDLKGYLALGDSLAFGFTPLTPLGDLRNYHGYPEIVADAIHRKLANASCFGESAQHFLASYPPTAPPTDLGCQAWRAQYPLFVSYSGTQMDFALQYLRDHSKTKLVTIDIGVNDLGVLLSIVCHGDAVCAFSKLPEFLSAYAANLTTIYSRIRSAGYRGPIVAVTGYYPFNYHDPQVGAFVALNSILASVTTAFHGKIADAFTAFGISAGASGNVCATGLLVKIPNSTACDTHPSAAGQALIAKLVLSQLDQEFDRERDDEE